jgi:hypothetical protein
MHPEISDDADSDSTKQGCGFHDPRTVLVPQGRIRDPEAHHCDRNAGPQHSKSRPYNRTPIDTPQTPVQHGDQDTPIQHGSQCRGQSQPRGIQQRHQPQGQQNIRPDRNPRSDRRRPRIL